MWVQALFWGGEFADRKKVFRLTSALLKASRRSSLEACLPFHTITLEPLLSRM